jgi:hypothetical protein
MDSLGLLAVLLFRFLVLFRMEDKQVGSQECARDPNARSQES